MDCLAALGLVLSHVVAFLIGIMVRDRWPADRRRNGSNGNGEGERHVA